MNDTEATRLLDRLAQTFPDEPAPVHSLLEASRGAQRARSRRTIAGAVVAVALVLGGGAVVQQAMDGGDSVPKPDTVAEPPSVPDGMRLVGMGRVVVAVPESWGTQQIRCGRPLRDTVYFQARALLCGGVSQTGVSSVLLMDATSEAGQQAVALATTEAIVNGIDVLRGPADCPDTGQCLLPAYSEVVAVPGQGVVLAVPLGGDDGGVLESLQLLPEDYTTVPYVEPGTRWSVAEDALGEAGLDTYLNARDMDVAVSGTEPVGGSVVKVGSTVMLAAFDDRVGSSGPCEVTLTQTDNVQVVPLDGSSRELKLTSTTPITVDIDGDCPADLSVSGAVVSGSVTRLGEQTDGTRPLVLSPRATHLVLTYQPCAETETDCRGPAEYKMFPIQLHSPSRTTQSALPESTPTEGHMRLIRDFVAFAVDPSATTAAALPFAPRVQLGLGSDIKAALGEAETPEPSAWVLDVEYFQGYVGPFSALELVQRHAREAQSQSVQPRGGAFQVSVGDHPHCVGTPVPAPRGFEDRRRVSLQPAESSIDSCLSWFSVDLFVNEAGRVSAVTLDVWEP